MISKIASFFFLTLTWCVGQDVHYSAISERLDTVQERLEVKRKDFGDMGVLFNVRIRPPTKMSYDPKAFSDLSEFASAVDIPCKRVQIGLNSYGPTGKKDLSLSLGLLRYSVDGSILLEFHLPQSHSGHKYGEPSLVLVCSEIYRPDGKFIDWIPKGLLLREKSEPNKAPEPTP